MLIVRFNAQAKYALANVAAAAGLLALDGELGPLSWPLRRVAASTLLAIIFAATGRGNLRWARGVAVAAAMIFIAFAPSAPFATLAYVFAIAVAGAKIAETRWPAPGLAQVCLAYVGAEFVWDLFPPSRIVSETFCAAADGYLRAATGTDHHLGPTAFGAPTAALAAMFLLWRWRLSASLARLLGAMLVPAAWFLALPLLVFPAAADPIAIFARGLPWDVVHRLRRSHRRIRAAQPRFRAGGWPPRQPDRSSVRLRGVSCDWDDTRGLFFGRSGKPKRFGP